MLGSHTRGKFCVALNPGQAPVTGGGVIGGGVVPDVHKPVTAPELLMAIVPVQGRVCAVAMFHMTVHAATIMVVTIAAMIVRFIGINPVCERDGVPGYQPDATAYHVGCGMLDIMQRDSAMMKLLAYCQRRAPW